VSVLFHYRARALGRKRKKRNRPTRCIRTTWSPRRRKKKEEGGKEGERAPRNGQLFAGARPKRGSNRGRSVLRFGSSTWISLAMEKKKKGRKLRSPSLGDPGLSYKSTVMRFADSEHRRKKRKRAPNNLTVRAAFRDEGLQKGGVRPVIFSAHEGEREGFVRVCRQEWEGVTTLGHRKGKKRRRRSTSLAGHVKVAVC